MYLSDLYRSNLQATRVSHFIHLIEFKVYNVRDLFRMSRKRNSLIEKREGTVSIRTI